MYPLKFENILKEVVWGGEKIAAYKGIASIKKNIGESWEISTIPNYVSIVSNGKWKGLPLTELIEKQKGAITGEKVYRKYKNTLPVLFKFLDTRDRCSVQVHPNDEIAQKRHIGSGKTEIWYVIEAEADSKLILGFSKPISIEEYRKRERENTLEEVLMSHRAKAGDVFFIPAGRIHAIGKGLLVAEIQQSSDTTYRVYDYGRKNADGTFRDLHIEESIEALDFSTHPEKELKMETDSIHTPSIELIRCKFFDIYLLTIKEKTIKDYRNLDSFVVYMCLHGACDIILPDLEKTSLRQGESVLIPASIPSFEIQPVSDNVKLIECYWG